MIRQSRRQNAPIVALVVVVAFGIVGLSVMYAVSDYTPPIEARTSLRMAGLAVVLAAEFIYALTRRA